MIKHAMAVAGIGVLALAITGCEWTTGSKVNSWDDSGNWVDFSGSYRAADGSILVRAFGAGTNITTNTFVSTNTVDNEHLDTGDGSRTAFDGRLAGRPVRGSLTIFTVGGYRFTDSAGGTADSVSLAVTPNDGSTGVFNYSTHAWALTFPAPIENGTELLATYQVVEESTEVNPVQGNHGNAIYTFTVYQTGNKLQLVDSNGARYDGDIGTVRTTGGRVIDLNDSTITPPSTGPVVAQFSATGVSQGYKVTIVGTLQGTLTAAQTLTARSMQATFIEESGAEADVKAVAQ